MGPILLEQAAQPCALKSLPVNAIACSGRDVILLKTELPLVYVKTQSVMPPKLAFIVIKKPHSFSASPVLFFLNFF